MSVWVDKVRANMTRLMTSDIIATAHNTFTETKGPASLISDPTSVSNGSYSVQSRGVTVDLELNPTMAFTYQTNLRLGFKLNPRERWDEDERAVVNDKRDYNNAIEDIELIIQKALTPTLYGGLLEQMEIINIGPLEYRDETETFATCDLVFGCRGRITP